MAHTGAYIQLRLFLIILIVTHFTMHAQVANLRFRNISTNDGLSFSTVSALHQDSKGRIWVGTVDGLNLYDGSTIKVFRHLENDSNSILNNQINDIAEDPDGQLWIATTIGICIYNPVNNTFFNINNILKKGRIKEITYISSIVIENKYTFWIGSNNGLLCIDYKSMSLICYNKGIEGLTIETLYLDKKKNLWVGFASHKLLCFNNKSKVFENPDITTKILKDKNINTVRSFLDDSQGNIWVGTDKGLEQYDTIKKVFIKHYYEPNNPKGPLKGMVRCLFEDNRNRLWVGFQYGLTIFDRNKHEFIKIVHDPSNPYSIGGQETWCMMQDKKGSVWFGMFTSGISIFDYDQSQFQLFTNDPNNDKSLIGNSVMNFCEDKLGNVWIGVDHAGLDYFDRKTNTFTHYRNDPKNSNSLSSNAVLSIDIDHNGILWIGTWGGGLNRFDPVTKTFKHFLPNPNNPNSINGIHIWRALEDKHNNLLIATQQEGLGYYVRAENKFITYVNDINNSKSIASSSINYIFRDKQENIWIGTSNGLSQLLGNFNFENYIPGRYVTDIYNDNKGKLWVATNGFLSVDIRSGKIKDYYNYQGIFNKSVTGILEDNHNNLWISSNNGGISKFNIKTETVKNYTQVDGLPSLSFNRRARIKLSDGKMMFCAVSSR
jgi:ligand-binding sensor domain-containing protein